MSKCKPHAIPAGLRDLQRASALMRRVIWLKRGIPLVLLALWTLVLLLGIWYRGTPADWTTETVQYARLEEQQVKRWSRHGASTKRVNVLITGDGREFRIADGMRVQAQLTAGEACTITYEPAPGQVLHIRALSTAEDGELMPLADSIAAHERLIQGLWWMLAIGAALCLTALALVEAFWLRTERAILARLEQEISHEKKRAGA